jgi:hypothetical protein
MIRPGAKRRGKLPALVSPNRVREEGQALSSAPRSLNDYYVRRVISIADKFFLTDLFSLVFIMKRISCD